MKKKILAVLLVALITTLTVFAASASTNWTTFTESIDSGDLSGAKDAYATLIDSVQKERSDASKSLEKAREKGNRELYLEAREELLALNSYSITKEQSDALLALIVEEDEEQAQEDAAWLYSISPYYSPTLSLDYSKSGESFSYSYRSSVTVRPGAEVTLPDQESINANSNNLGLLSGWGVTEDSVTYTPGETIKMPLTDQTLYAIWENSVTFKDEKSGVDQKIENVTEGDEIAIPAVANTEDGSVFIGWYDSNTGEFIGSSEESYTVRGSGAQFEALYASLSIENLRTIPYSTLPRNTQVTLTFNVKNTGNEDMRNLTVNISSEDETLTVLNDTLYFRRLPKNSTGSVSTRVVYTGTERSKSIPISVTVSDADGHTWSNTFSITSK